MTEYNYEKKILALTTHHVNALVGLVKLVLPLFEERAFTKWYEFLVQQAGPDRDRTKKEVKTLRVVVRRLYRVSNQSTSVRLILDFMMQRVGLHL